jgi:hypothetical protein
MICPERRPRKKKEKTKAGKTMFANMTGEILLKEDKKKVTM